MVQKRIGYQCGEYRGQSFMIRARQEGEVWTGHCRLMGAAEAQLNEAAATAQHRWTPLDPVWGTENEAQMNATEAAHAAIDSLLAKGGR